MGARRAGLEGRALRLLGVSSAALAWFSRIGASSDFSRGVIYMMPLWA